MTMAGVAVVHYGEPEPTLRCLASVAADRSAIARRIVVIDNSGNLERRTLATDVDLVSRPDNPGFGTAVNLGVNAVDPDRGCSFYLALNNDAVLDDGFLDAAAAALVGDVGAVGGPIRTGRAPRHLWYAGGGINFLTGTVRQRHSPSAARRRDVGFIPATAIAVAAEAWHEIGGFDPRFFLYNEDVDLCLRLRRAGWRLVFEPGMACNHDLGGATGSDERSPLYLEHLARTRLLPFRPRLYRLYLGGVHSLYNVVRAAALALRYGRRSGPYVRALARGHLAALKLSVR